MQEMPLPQVPEAAPTTLLYHTDAYRRNFEARIVATDGAAVAFDQTAFYPGGGGQMADHGVVMWDGRRLPLAGIAKRGEVVWHELALDGAPVPPIGAAVKGEVDWDFRYRMMRTHTARR